MKEVIKILLYGILLLGLVAVAVGEDQIGLPSEPILRDDSGLWTSPEGLPIAEADWYVGGGLTDAEIDVTVEPAPFDWMELLIDIFTAPFGVD